MQRAIAIFCDSSLYPFVTVFLKIIRLVVQHSKGATWQVNEDDIILH